MITLYGGASACMGVFVQSWVFRLGSSGSAPKSPLDNTPSLLYSSSSMITISRPDMGVKLVPYDIKKPVYFWNFDKMGFALLDPEGVTIGVHTIKNIDVIHDILINKLYTIDEAGVFYLYSLSDENGWEEMMVGSTK